MRADISPHVENIQADISPHVENIQADVQAINMQANSYFLTVLLL